MLFLERLPPAVFESRHCLPHALQLLIIKAINTPIFAAKAGNVSEHQMSQGSVPPERERTKSRATSEQHVLLGLNHKDVLTLKKEKDAIIFIPNILFKRSIGETRQCS